MTTDISIIIPMYNVENYVSTAIESVINNEWKGYRYELILIDDGSPDDSILIALEYEKNNQNIKVLSQENKGLGGARNTGIRNATGTFLFFLDSDDYLLNNQLEKMLSIAINEDLDVLEFAAKRVTDKYVDIDEIFINKTLKVYTGLEYLKSIQHANSACNKLYNRAFINRYSLFFYFAKYRLTFPLMLMLYAIRKILQSKK